MGEIQLGSLDATGIILEGVEELFFRRRRRKFFFLKIHLTADLIASQSLKRSYGGPCRTPFANEESGIDR